ncbi:NFACT RNA binding domain-containing protein [Roseivirga echinicomitans]
MHLNFYVLKRLSNSLGSTLQGAVLAESFSQEKDELILGFILGNKENFYIRATLQSDFTALSFPENFARSKRNSADIFAFLIHCKVQSVHQYENERAFHITFKNGAVLLFKMHGNRSNIILIPKGQSPQLFKKKLIIDKNISLTSLERPIDRSEALYLSAPDYHNFYPTFGKLIKAYLGSINFNDLAAKEQWFVLEDLIYKLEHNPFYISYLMGAPVLTLVDYGENTQALSSDPIHALNRFYQVFHTEYFFEKEKNNALQLFSKKISQAKNYMTKTEAQLAKLETATAPNQIADIIMANMHGIPTGVSTVTLFNFYTEEDIEVKLNKSLSPQKNAENYYRKSKNRRIEVDKLTENIINKEAQLSLLQQQKDAIFQVETLKALRSIIKNSGIEPSQSTQEVHLPYKTFNVQGYQVWVGKNAKSNDELTLKHSYKEDLWLHAKDVPGSHVLIKHQAGKNIPVAVIERAAAYAAYYSKRKTDTLVPVIYTPVKYVRKKKGTPPGQVFVAQEKVLMIPSQGPESAS